MAKLKPAAPAPSSSELHAIKHYTSSGYKSMNRALRYGLATGTPEINNLTNWLERAKLPEEIVVSRKVSSDYAEFLMENTKVGSVFVDYGFASTSVSHGTWSGDVKMEIKLPAGAKAALVDHLSANQGEKEVLVQRGSRFRVVGYTSTGWKKGTIQLEYVKEDKDA